MKIFLATENAGKVHEVRGIFAQKLPEAELQCIADLPHEIRSRYVAEETGLTYAENALIKARALADLADGSILADAKTPSPSAQLRTGVAAPALNHPWILAEDSGFEVEALGRAPGIYSARYAPDDKARCEKILAAIHDVPVSRRQAQFVACVALIEKKPGHPCPPVYFFGRRTGIVAPERRGDKGFGYDPIFIPDGETHTWGEAPEKSKILVSHRGLAMGLAIQYLIVRLSQKRREAAQ